MDAELRELCERLRGLLATAVPTPWALCQNPPNEYWHAGVTIGAESPEDARRIADVLTGGMRGADIHPLHAANAALIVSAVNAMPLLLDTIAAQAAELERVEVDGIHSCDDECQRPMCVLRREKARLAAELEGVRKDAEERVRLHHYWRQRAKSAEGHLFASDLTHAAMAIHARSLKAETPWEELDWREKGARLGCAMDVIVRVNNRRDERLPKDTAIADSGAGGCNE